jgi:hypothetical protein
MRAFFAESIQTVMGDSSSGNREGRMDFEQQRYRRTAAAFSALLS